MWHLALRNLWQKKSRTLFTLVGLALATGTLFSLLAFQRGYQRGLKAELEQLGAHILVVPKGCPYDAASVALHGANWPCFLKEAYLAQVAQTPGVAVAAPVFMGSRFQSNQNSLVVLGITRAYLQLKPGWRIVGQFPAQPDELLLGADKAREFAVQVGSTLQLRALARTFRVAGILEQTAAPDDSFVFIPLAAAQEIFKQSGHLTHVLVKLQSPEMLEKTVEGLRGCDAGMQMNIIPLAHLFETIRNVSASAKYLLAAISLIAFLVAGTALTNTMLMAVLERTREIGVLRAIGASRSQVFVLFLSETALLGIFGAFLGGTVALLGARLIEGWIRSQISYAPAVTLIRLDAVPMLVAAGFALVISLIVGLLPAWRATRLHPVEAFRAQASY